jgi:hypothetical protein
MATYAQAVLFGNPQTGQGDKPVLPLGLGSRMFCLGSRTELMAPRLRLGAINSILDPRRGTFSMSEALMVKPIILPLPLLDSYISEISIFAKGYRCLSSTLCGVYTLLLQRCFLSDLDFDLKFSRFRCLRYLRASTVSLRRVECAFAAVFLARKLGGHR